MKKAFIIGLLMAAVLFLVAGLAFTGPDAASQSPEEVQSGEKTATVPSRDVYTVVVENGRFMPVDLEVKAGDTVQWVNLDDQDHSVTLDHCDVDVLLPAGSTFRYTFTEEGEFHYLSLLGEAQGTVTVR